MKAPDHFASAGLSLVRITNELIMHERMNRRLRRRVGSDAALEARLAGVELAPDLRAILDAGLARESGATFLAALRPSVGDLAFPSAHLPDLTGVECYVNHLHVSDFTGDTGTDPLLQGFRFALDLAELARTVPRPFRIIVAASDDDVRVRFHERRPGEVWLEDDLEKYTEEGIAVFDL